MVKVIWKKKKYKMASTIPGQKYNSVEKILINKLKIIKLKIRVPCLIDV